MIGPRLLLFAALVALLGCGSSAPAPPPGPTAPTDGLSAGCNPLRENGACLLPFPSAIFLDEDGTTPTGFRVHLSSELMPQTEQGVAYDPVRMNLADGFSPSCEILAYFPDRIEPFPPGSSLGQLYLFFEVLSFIPVGFLLVWARRPPIRPIPATALAAALAVVLAAGKLLFADRREVVADVVMQVAGALLGALLAARLARNRAQGAGKPTASRKA